MAREDEIESCKKAFKDKSDSQLIHETHMWVAHSAHHIAARMILEERRLEREEDRHARIEARLNELKKPHWTVNPNFWVTVVAAIAAIVGAYLAWLALPRGPSAPISMPPVSAPSSPPTPQPAPMPPKQ